MFWLQRFVQPMCPKWHSDGHSLRSETWRKIWFEQQERWKVKVIRSTYFARLDTPWGAQMCQQREIIGRIVTYTMPVKPVTGVWTAALHCTCRTTVSWPPVLTLGDSCVPATVNFCSTSLPAQYLCLPGLFSSRPHSLELSPGFYLGPDHQCRLFQRSA